MTRREIYFYDKDNSKLYVTPEFNGDKNEFLKFKKHGDSCDRDWNEIIKEFENVRTLREFKEVSNKAQGYYHSFLGDEILPIREVEEIAYNNEIFMINDKGEVYLYNPKELSREYLIDVEGKGNFQFQNFIMRVEKYFSKYSDCNIYSLNIEKIENISTPKKLKLGAIEDSNITSNLDEFLNKELGDYTKLINKMKENLEREPIKLKLINSPNNNFTIAFESEKGSQYVLNYEKDFFELIKIDNSKGEPEYNLNIPIEIDGKVIYPIYDSWLGEPIYDLDKIDLRGLEMAEIINSYMIIEEDIFDKGSINSNLNDIYRDIYNKEYIEKYIFNRYKDNEYISELKEKYYRFLESTQLINKTLNENNEEEEYEPTN